MAHIQFSGVGKRYPNGFYALENLNLEIQDKEFLVLLGPSGCGKSTTLNMIAGLEDITDGTLSFDGKVVNATPPHQRDIAMVFQSYALYPHKSVYENIAFGLRMRKYPNADVDRLVRDAAQRLEITALLDRKPGQLSGGQRQRVALGRAMVRSPSAFLMDEPLSNLDAALRITMRAEIKQLHQSMQTTFIYVTHDQAEALTLADRIVVMKDGLILQIGTPNQIYEHPNNMFVASFLGVPQINFMPGRLVQDDHVVSFKNDFLSIDLPSAVSSKFPSNIAGEVTLGIRAEDVELVVGPLLGQSMSGVIKSVLPVGSDQYLEITVAGERKKSYYFRIGKEYQPAEGDAVHFKFNTNRLHFFHSDTGVSLFANE